TVRDAIPPAAVPTGASGVSAPTASIPGAGDGQLPPSTPAAPAKPTVQHPLWAQAEAAERDGRSDEAEKLFFQLARAMNEPGGDHDVANLCYTRIHTLREKRRGAAASPVSTAPLGPPTRPVTGEKRKPAAEKPEPRDRDDGGKWTGPG